MTRDGYERLPMYASTSSPRLRLPSSSAADDTLRSPNSSHVLSSDYPYTIHSSSPHRARNTPNTPKHTWYPRPRTVFTFLKFAVPLSAVVLLFGLYVYEPHIELAFYPRKWIKSEIETIEPLAGCFDPSRVSDKYNMSEAVYGKKYTVVQAGMPLRMGLDCYDFAGTVRSAPSKSTGSPTSPADRTQYHTYWRADLAPFGKRQEWMLKSFFATQNTATSRLILWSNGDLGADIHAKSILETYLRRYPDAFDLRIVNIPDLARGTELEGSQLLTSKDTKAWVDGDLVRLLLLWNFGGVWVDMDSLLTRDLEPLLEHEFVTQWDCYDKVYQPFNGALMRFRQHSPYLCEAFHVMQTSAPPRAGSTDWGSLLYHKVWRRLVAGSIPPFQVLPFCFSDARSCRLDNRLPDPFLPDPSDGKWTKGLGMEAEGGLDRALGNIFGVHLHNQWEKPYPGGGWVERLLLNRYDSKLNVL